MTVPTDFRRNSEIPGILVLHYANIVENDVQTSQGYRFTRALRTILDLIDAGTVEPRFVRQALRQALDRGLIAHHQIQDRHLTGAAREMFEDVMRQAV